VLDLPAAPEPQDPLVQTTRAHLFVTLGELARPAGTGELAVRLHLHPNGVRLHLARLERAGLVTRSRARQARGRPRDVWEIAASAHPGGRAPRAYSDLGRWFARAMGTGRSGLRGAEATGREIGRELAKDAASGAGTDAASSAGTDAASDGGQALRTTLIALGFQPSVAERTKGALTIRLGNCPYRDAARESQPIVCALHKGITRGLLELLQPGAKLAAFLPGDPDRAGCVIELRGMTREPGRQRQPPAATSRRR
jgi:predicted ArsR family transcriptional regulator